jgi:hypothetical protein
MFLCFTHCSRRISVAMCFGINWKLGDGLKKNMAVWPSGIVSACHGEDWIYGSMGLWVYGSMGLWVYGSMGLCVLMVYESWDRIPSGGSLKRKISKVKGTSTWHLPRCNTTNNAVLDSGMVLSKNSRNKKQALLFKFLLLLLFCFLKLTIIVSKYVISHGIT